VRQDGWRHGPALAQLLGRTSLRGRLVAAALCLLAAGAAVITLASGRVARGYLMAQADRQLLAYADRLTSRPFAAAPMVPADADPMGTGVGKLSIQVRNSDGQLVLRAGPAGHPGPAAWAVTPRFGQLTTLPGATGGSYLAVAEPIRYSARHIPFAYSAADFSLVVTTRAGPGLDGTLIVGLDLASIDQLTSTLTTVGLAASGLALLAVAGLGTVAIRAALRPFTRLETTAAAIAAGGPAEPGLAGQAGQADDDPRRLASPLNSVLARMAQSRSAAEAAAAADRAERVPRAVAEISQELRRPISVLRGLAEHYRQQGALPAGERDRLLRRVAEEAARIDALADDLRRSFPDERVSGPPRN
jgi:signal transduction histidine kinase